MHQDAYAHECTAHIIYADKNVILLDKTYFTLKAVGK